MSSMEDRLKALETSPDLSNPSIDGLIWYLRNPEMWPDEFVWDFRYPDNCALGLCRRVFGVSAPSLMPEAAYVDQSELFHSFKPGGIPTANDIADRLEAWHKANPQG